jgi:hypothetical protein
MLTFAGVTAIAASAAAVTVNPVDPEIPPIMAVIVVDPGLNAAVCPDVPALVLTVATAGAEELQVTSVVKFCVE